jgi:putative DNA primase/helicase
MEDSRLSDRSADLNSVVPLSDQWNAELLVEKYGDDIRYIYQWKSWLVWDGKVWKRDQSGAVMRRAKDTIRQFLIAAVKEYEGDSDSRKALNLLKTKDLFFALS